MKILVTGAAGFIGYHLCQNLLKNRFEVVGLDNINDYYNVDLKYDRLEQFGVKRKDAEQFHKMCLSDTHGERFKFIRMSLQDKNGMENLFNNEKFEIVYNLAAQAGVRYSLENPQTYIDSNVNGFLNILECCRYHKIKHLIYASSSSVYGLNDQLPFSTHDKVDRPISLYAASKKSNELMAHTYSHLFKIPTTGLRLFTVYGPWGRPEMAMFLFTDAIANNRPLKVFNHGKMERDFTYVGDIVNGLVKILEKDLKPRIAKKEYYKIYNMGNNKSVKLMDFIKAIETNLNLKAKLELLPIQPGDVEKTWANVDELIKDYSYYPDTQIHEGVATYVNWYKSYYSKVGK